MIEVKYSVSNSPELLHEPLKYKRNVAFSGFIEIPEGMNVDKVSKRLRSQLAKLKDEMNA